MTTQPDLFPPVDPGVTEAEMDTLRTHLFSHGWQTRRQLCTALGWDERQVRNVAEAMGADIIRGQAGFHLTNTIDRQNPRDVARAVQARDAALSQARKMQDYGLALSRRIHALIG